jgi:hypothetical protein
VPDCATPDSPPVGSENLERCALLKSDFLTISSRIDSSALAMCRGSLWLPVSAGSKAMVRDGMCRGLGKVVFMMRLIGVEMGTWIDGESCC